jgi:hypothetical protein
LYLRVQSAGFCREKRLAGTGHDIHDIYDIPSSNDPADITELTTIDQSLLLALWQTLASQ